MDCVNDTKECCPAPPSNLENKGSDQYNILCTKSLVHFESFSCKYIPRENQLCGNNTIRARLYREKTLTVTN